VIKNLKQKKVDTSLVQKVSSSETGFSFLLVAQGNEHIVFSNRGANSELRIKNEELKIIKNTEWIYLTSLSGKWEEVLRKVFSVSEVKFAWNPGHVQLRAGIKKIGRFLKQTNILFVNKDEANELAMSDPAYNKNNYEFFGNIKNLLKILKGYGPEIVVITNGRKGADAFDGVNFYHQDIMREKKVVDTTGVGDAFNSSFVAGLKLFKGDIQKAMHLGIKNTSLVVAKQGAQNGLLTRRQIVA
jgi:ribokinase